MWQLCSVFGVVGVTDLSVEALSKSCSRTLTTLDVNGCIGIKVGRCWLNILSSELVLTYSFWVFLLQRRSKKELLQLFPKILCFKVHSWVYKYPGHSCSAQNVHLSTPTSALLARSISHKTTFFLLRLHVDAGNSQYGVAILVSVILGQCCWSSNLRLELFVEESWYCLRVNLFTPQKLWTKFKV